MRREKMKKSGWILIVCLLMATVSWSVAIAEDDPKCEPKWEKDGALCYPECKAGYKGVGPVCWQTCAPGFRDDGAYCAKPKPYGRGTGYPWKAGDKPFSLDDARKRCNKDHPQGCEKHGAIIYPKCKEGFHATGCCICSPNCPQGQTDIGLSCAKKSYGRGAGKPLLGLGQSLKDCYDKKDDHDGDGYARKNAPVKEVRKWDYKLNCPDGYVNKEGDRNDNDKSIHPRRDEVPFNGKDDNSSDKTDEPTFVYSTNPTRNDGFEIKVRINCLNTMKHRNNLYADLKIFNLSNSGTDIPFPIEKVNVIEDAHKNAYVTINVKKLLKATVYRLRVQFYYKDGKEYKPVGAESDRYYTTTWSDDRVEQARSAILLRGFKEYDESNLGRVGYKGTDKVDGTKYGADKNEQWCSEFYVWVTKDNLKDIKGRTYVSRLVDYFQDYKSTYGRSQIINRAKRGDYIAISTKGTEKKDHSAMFLAYDEGTKKIWTLEGNVGNAVGVKERATGGDDANDIVKLGGIVSSMLK
jgi:hypothetical protein